MKLQCCSCVVSLGRGLDKADAEFFADVLTLMVNHVAELDDQLAPLLDRAGEHLDVVERVFCGWLRRS